MKTFNVARARFAQKVIASRVIEEDVLPKEIRTVAGVDVAHKGSIAIASAVLINFYTLELISYTIVEMQIRIPYIPTLLAFREAGPMVAAVRKLNADPDVLMVDGNGRLHPLGAGIACQVGLVLDKPTIGIAKKLLCGNIGEWQGREAPIRLSGKIVGMALRTSSKPIYVSVGHKISLPTAVSIVWKCTKRGLRLPEPIRLAHIVATDAARG